MEFSSVSNKTKQNQKEPKEKNARCIYIIEKRVSHGNLAGDQVRITN
jgi:hypothetical protein